LKRWTSQTDELNITMCLIKQAGADAVPGYRLRYPYTSPR